jgi:hypothetical protein
MTSGGLDFDQFMKALISAPTKPKPKRKPVKRKRAKK